MPVVTLKDFEFEHVLDWDESSTSVIEKKRPIGKCSPTVDADPRLKSARVIIINARTTKARKATLKSICKECAWLRLKEDATMIDYVWVREARFRWDSALGCGGRPWRVTLTLVCSGT